MYADDAALIVSGRCVADIEANLASELSSLRVWLEENKLSLHLGKTESILFGTSKRLANRKEMNIMCKGTNIESKSCVKYLGVNIDQDMSCTTVGNNCLKKINGKLKFLYRKASFFRTRERKMLSSALLQSHFDYASNFWYRGMSCDLKSRLQRAQNKIIRYILNYDNRKHIGYNEFRTVRMLNVKYRIDYLTLSHMYNVFNGNAPSYLCNIEDTRHEYNTRSQSSYILPHVKTQGKKTFKYNGIRLWNSLSLELRCSNSKEIFKQNLKEVFMLKMKDEEESEFVV
jgi:hypothetical protein